MKFYDIILFILIFNVMGNALISSGMFTHMSLVNYYITGNMTEIQSDLSSIESQFNTSTAISSEDPISKLFGLESVSRLTAGTKFFLTLYKYLFLPSVILGYFGIPWQINLAVTTLLFIVYLVGFLQFISGRNIKQSE